MESIIDICQRYSKYQITDYVQKLDFFKFDYDLIKKEILDLIIKNNYGTNIVSLKLQENNTNYIDTIEQLELDAERHHWHNDDPTRKNYNHNVEYTVWHPDLTNSYTKSLSDEFEKITGFKIGRVRLAWLMPHFGYPIHCDLEPTRFHIPIITNPFSYIIHDRKIYHMEYGNVYHLITAKEHTAWNFGTLPRLHLVFSTYLDEEFENSIRDLSDNSIIKQKTVESLKESNIDSRTLYELMKIFTSNPNHHELVKYCKELIKAQK